jgi:hypothetical protein
VVDDDPCGRIRWCEDIDRLASIAIGSHGEVLLEDEGVEAGIFPGLDGDEEGWWWLTTVRSEAGGSAQRAVVQWGREEAKWEGGNFARPHAR